VVARLRDTWGRSSIDPVSFPHLKAERTLSRGLVARQVSAI
jgi:hypothetical protein